VIDLELAVALDELAGAIARIRPPMNSNPHAFHEDRSELASRARTLALRARGVGCKPSEAADVPAPIGRQRVATHRVRDLDGRSVLVLTRRGPHRPGCASNRSSFMQVMQNACDCGVDVR
jgi:hypothetical protein